MVKNSNICDCGQHLKGGQHYSGCISVLKPKILGNNHEGDGGHHKLKNIE